RAGWRRGEPAQDEAERAPEERSGQQVQPSAPPPALAAGQDAIQGVLRLRPLHRNQLLQLHEPLAGLLGLRSSILVYLGRQYRRASVTEQEMNLLLTGASGQLGSYILRHLRDIGGQVRAWSGSRAGDLFGVSLRRVDLTAEEAVRRAFAEDAPDVVLHAAALA